MVLVVLLAICLALFASVTVATLRFRGGSPGGDDSAWTVRGDGRCLLVCRSLRQWKVRTKRVLKRNPDLVGTARGELNSSGLRFDDGVHQYWFGPAHMLDAKIMDRGIRVGVDANPDRYLALTDRLFEAYDPKAVHRLHRQLGALSATPEARQRPGYRGPLESDQRGAGGGDSLSRRSRSRGRRESAASRRQCVIAASAAGPFYLNFSEPWTLWAAGILVLYGLAINSKKWRSFVERLSQQVWNCDGWLTADEVAIHNGETGVRMPAKQLAVSQIDDGLMLSTKGGAAYYLARDQLVEPDQWPRLCSTLLVGGE